MTGSRCPFPFAKFSLPEQGGLLGSGAGVEGGCRQHGAKNGAAGKRKGLKDNIGACELCVCHFTELRSNKLGTEPPLPRGMPWQRGTPHTPTGALLKQAL